MHEVERDEVAERAGRCVLHVLPLFEGFRRSCLVVLAECDRAGCAVIAETPTRKGSARGTHVEMRRAHQPVTIGEERARGRLYSIHSNTARAEEGSPQGKGAVPLTVHA